MKPLSLHATNYVRFPTLDVTFTEGSTACVGPNGAGKSAILRVVDLSLFADGSRDLAQWLAPFGERMELLLEFEHDGETYRVRRTYKGGASAKAALDLEVLDDLFDPDGAGIRMCARPLTLASTKETQALLESTLGLNRRTFAASSYLAQGNEGSLTKASPAERKDLIAEAIDPRGYWPSLAAKATAERKEAERALEADRVRIGERDELIAAHTGIEDELEDRQIARAEAKRAVDDADEALTVAQSNLAVNAAAVERAKAAGAAEGQAILDVGAARDRLAEAREKAELLEPARVELAELAQQAGRVTELEARVEKVRSHAATVAADERRQADADRAVELQDANVRERIRNYTNLADQDHALLLTWQRYVHADNGYELCDRCGQALGEEARLAAVANVLAERETLAERMRETKHGIEAAQKHLDEYVAAAGAIIIYNGVVDAEAEGLLSRARAAAEQRSGLAERIRGYEEQAQRIPDLELMLTAAELELERRAAASLRIQNETGNEPELQRAVGSAVQRQRIAREALDKANAAVTRLEEQLARVKQAQVELEALKKSTASLQQDLDLLRLAERAFGRDGIPVMLVENTLTQIETNANGYLKMMPTTDGTTLRVQLETQRQQKTVEHLKETLDILCSDADTTRPYETFSGGEGSRLDFCLGLSLAILLTDRRGAESRALLIDELEGLDEQGQRDLVRVIESVRDRFDVIVVASHYPGIRDAFDNVITVRKDDGISRLEAA